MTITVHICAPGLTLLLSLRFMAVAFEEVRNLALGVAARGVKWQQLGKGGSLRVHPAHFPCRRPISHAWMVLLHVMYCRAYLWRRPVPHAWMVVLLLCVQHVVYCRAFRKGLVSPPPSKDEFAEAAV